MTNQQLKAHCEDVIANPQDHLDWVVDMARVALASLEANQKLNCTDDATRQIIELRQSGLTQEQMKAEASIYRHDNDEGTPAWFDASEAIWIEGYISPSSFHHIFKPSEAGQWLDDEIKALEDDGRNADSYLEIKSGETVNPVVVVFHEGRFVVWDGFHRIAGAVALNRPVYAIFAHAPPVPVMQPVVLPVMQVDNPLDGFFYRCDEVIAAIRAAGGSVKE